VVVDGSRDADLGISRVDPSPIRSDPILHESLYEAHLLLTQTSRVTSISIGGVA
jgi:hypothetical protein